mgnify:CR=1 FL=1
MVKSPFIDALSALEDIRDFCEDRQKCYEGWSGPTPEAIDLDLKRVLAKAEKAIKALTPGSSEPAKDSSHRLTVTGSDGEIITYKGTFE